MRPAVAAGRPTTWKSISWWRRPCRRCWRASSSRAFRAVSEAAHRDHGGRPWLDFVIQLANGQELESDAERSAACEAAAVRVYSRARMVHDPADGGAGQFRRASRSFGRIGWDRLLFATDYPHWDFDDPRTAFKANLSDAQRHQLLYGNARKFYGSTNDTPCRRNRRRNSTRRTDAGDGRRARDRHLQHCRRVLRPRQSLPHNGGSLCKGRIVGLVEASEPGEYRVSRRGEFVRCPWHGWEFDLRTGKSWCEPDRTKVRSYDLKVEPGAALTEETLTAETFPVSVENNTSWSKSSDREPTTTPNISEDEMMMKTLNAVVIACVRGWEWPRRRTPRIPGTPSSTRRKRKARSSSTTWHSARRILRRS